MSEMPSERDFLAEADDVIRVHWRCSDQPWERRCDDCTDDSCPKLRWAEDLVDGLHWLSARWPVR